MVKSVFLVVFVSILTIIGGLVIGAVLMLMFSRIPDEDEDDT